ncbi:unnamed protein product [Cylicostephanus goldi]|uniref:Uncharacterized protein n=1 Tax=Cylicostephanus goldi TaxID=71465 RepID=A0A3P6S054_CYLGO|nr:unnamed protein product [Cylicostephanus goldi]
MGSLALQFYVWSTAEIINVEADTPKLIVLPLQRRTMEAVTTESAHHIGSNKRGVAKAKDKEVDPKQKPGDPRVSMDAENFNIVM